ncbi:VF530 family DNA-binding protein [Psychromonas aquimarina]|uniref:VF530 family protein n=1 Tax=Psychromonas aquimarina TaxID=444919 RepID=UPI000424AFAB|nr:VF530 family protein [Psychromonas aquimarina]
MNNSNDPLHGVKLEKILTDLEAKLGWKEMGELLNINCFINKPRLKSSLKFLRQTPWARSKVEILYLKTFCSDHPAAAKLIRGAIERKRADAEQYRQKNTAQGKTDKKDNKSKQNNNSGFTWPTLKKGKE